MLFAAAFYAATYATVRYLSKEGFETFQIVFFRSFLGIIFLLPWLFKSEASGYENCKSRNIFYSNGPEFWRDGAFDVGSGKS